MSPPPTVPEHLPAIAHGGDSFEGFPGDFGSSELRAAELELELEPEEQPETRKAEYLPVSGFPSVGLRGGFERRSSNSDMGVFLARRGDDDTPYDSVLKMDSTSCRLGYLLPHPHLG
ncbi:hypothetical protein K466DRAFT_602362 [Polyporus arcularius HHB13444]|uniref:Uncharacterized protein n=1 Tax=Polyporus arcularius HHB13444 TaxID=1314778 RepID=A0A5C3P4V4_9APHY|nr:hypothetical protein K466DRAFT_602362 [Polyporus arcularius HHB13444]